MRPVVSGLDKKYGKQVAFAAVDYYNGKNRDVVRKYRVLGHPTFVVLGKDGQVIQRFVGYTEADALEAAIKQAAGS